jgi:hypothetical protein
MSSLHEIAVQNLIAAACKGCAGTGRLHSRVAQTLSTGQALTPRETNVDCAECQGTGFAGGNIAVEL